MDEKIKNMIIEQKTYNSTTLTAYTEFYLLLEFLIEKGIISRDEFAEFYGRNFNRTLEQLMEDILTKTQIPND